MADAPSSLPTHEPVNSALPSNTELFLEQHFKKILLFVLLAVLLLATLWGVRYLKHQKERAAGEQFSSAQSVEDYDIVIQQFPDTAAAGNAQLLKARALWKEGKKESSTKTIQEFIAAHPKHNLLPEALLALGTQQAALGEKDAAKQTLETLVKNHPDSEIAPAAQIRIGDLLWADGKVDEAKKLFDSLPQTYPGKMSVFVDELDQRTRLLNAGLPTKEIDAPAPPPVPVPAPSLTPTLPTPTLPTPTLPTPALPTAPDALTPSSLPAAPAPAPATSEPTPAPAAPVPAAAPAAEAPPAPAAPAPMPTPAAEAPAPPAPASEPAPAAPTPTPAPQP